MSKYKISVLIPSRSEEFLAKTIEDILENTDDITEIIAVLDGEWATPEIPVNERLTVIYLPESIGQRSATNLACKLSRAKYVIKCDAHVSFDKGLDRKMLKAFEKSGDNTLMVPVMRNLWAFDWKCFDCGYKKYQGPKPEKCEKCGGTNIKKKIVWIAKKSPQSISYCFDNEPHFQYFKEYAKKPEYQKDLKETGLTKTMSIQGSFFMCTREKYWELNVCDDEGFGSWGSQGIETSLKFWLSGGRVLVNHNTWNSHMFRTQGKGFSFPYPQSGRQVQNAKKYARDLFFNNKWKHQIHPLSWLLEKFWPVRGWTEKDLAEQKERERNHPKFGKIKNELKKGIIFYTDNQLNLKIAHKVQKQLKKISKEKGIPIVSASLKPMNFGENIVLNEKRGHLTMFKQILAGLKASTADIIFFAEHDVLYHPSHFDFIPPKKDVYFYNLNVWKLREDGLAVKVDDCKQTSGLCAYRELLIGHYERRIAKILQNQKDLAKEGKPIKNDGFSRHMGFEPGGHSKPRGVDNYKREGWESKYPIIDIRHTGNLTPNRWDKSEFRDKKYTKGWTECNIKDIEGIDADDLKDIINIGEI